MAKANRGVRLYRGADSDINLTGKTNYSPRKQTKPVPKTASEAKAETRRAKAAKAAWQKHRKEEKKAANRAIQEGFIKAKEERKAKAIQEEETRKRRIENMSEEERRRYEEAKARRKKFKEEQKARSKRKKGKGKKHKVLVS